MEDAVNLFGIADANLSMRLVVKSRVWVNTFSFGENTANRVKTSFSGFLPRDMKVVDDGAIEIAKKEVVSSEIFRHRNA